jgi:hypothetical protein
MEPLKAKSHSMVITILIGIPVIWVFNKPNAEDGLTPLENVELSVHDNATLVRPKRGTLAHDLDSSRITKSE